jgi:hypothetical protein
MIWALPAEVRAYRDAQAAAFPDETWPTLSSDDLVVQTQIDSAVRAMVPSVLWWPCLDELDRADDDEVRELLIVAVAETIRARLVNATAGASLGGDTIAAVLAAGGSFSADNLSVSGGSGARVGARATAVPARACEALAEAGMTGGPVATC